MNRMQRDVAIFNAGIDTPRGDTPELRAAELRARLILEEAFEACIGMLGESMFYVVLDAVDNKVTRGLGEAHRNPNLVEAIDGLTDLLYVTFGAFDAFGVDADEPFDLVHAANMTKLRAGKDEHGKQVKPPGFVPPQEKIRALLVRLGAKL
jgi:predicted HAD superfamily Cof-like phosphohydrolase